MQSLIPNRYENLDFFEYDTGRWSEKSDTIT